MLELLALQVNRDPLVHKDQQVTEDRQDRLEHLVNLDHLDLLGTEDSKDHQEM